MCSVSSAVNVKGTLTEARGGGSARWFTFTRTSFFGSSGQGLTLTVVHVQLNVSEFFVG